MPLTGSDAALSALLFSNVQTALAATGKPPLPSSLPNLQALCDGLAKGIILHLLAAGSVSPGQLVVTNTGSGTVTTPGLFI